MTALERVESAPAMAEGLLLAIKAAEELDDLTAVRANIAAAREWAKVVDRTQELRFDLLQVEVEALVRTVELGGSHLLKKSDRDTGEYFAGLSHAQRVSFLIKEGKEHATAAGMYRAYLRAQREAEWERRYAQLKLEKESTGRQFALTPRLSLTPYAADDGAGDLENHFSGPRNLGACVSNALDVFTGSDGFTINEFANEVIELADLGQLRDDDDVMEGVREVCRRAIRSAPYIEIGGTKLPRFVTAPMDDSADESFFRVPVENASVAHFAQMVEMRESQLAQDAAKLSDLRALLLRLRELAQDDGDRIGGLVANGARQTLSEVSNV